MTPEEFLDLACKLALDHEERMVNEEQFHPILLERGLSAIEIESLTVTLAARHKIERLPFVGGSADFEISKPAFMDYVLRTLPEGTVNKGLELCKTWGQRGGREVNAQLLATELSLSPFIAGILFECCVNRLRN